VAGLKKRKPTKPEGPRPQKPVTAQPTGKLIGPDVASNKGIRFATSGCYLVPRKKGAE
jgi:hypothetical protein